MMYVVSLSTNPSTKTVSNNTGTVGVLYFRNETDITLFDQNRGLNIKIPQVSVAQTSTTETVELNSLGLFNQIKFPGPDTGTRISIQRQYYPLYQETFKSLKVNFVNPRVELADGFFQKLDFLDYHHYGNDRQYRFVRDINQTVFTDQNLPLEIFNTATTQKSALL